MLTIPTNTSSLASIIGLDPGSTMFGVGLLNVDLDKMKIVSSDAWTINGAKLAGKDSWLEEMHGNRVARIYAIEDKLVNIFNYYQPIAIISESPFINSRFPAAGIALTEVMCSIRRAVIRYSQWKSLHLFSPSEVKNAVGATGGAKKDLMRNRILSLEDELHYNGKIPITELDEHSIDALAVGYAKFKLYLE